jgi:DNA-binding NtrC family response regulator
VTVAEGNTSEATTLHPHGAQVDVLVVDDDEAIRSTWAALLRSSSYTVEVVDDGDVALDFLEQREAGLVLLDLRMPRLDGLSVLEALKTPQLVVLASGVALDEATMARVEAKVVTFLEKPVPPERLLDVVSATLRPTLVADVP